MRRRELFRIAAGMPAWLGASQPGGSAHAGPPGKKQRIDITLTAGASPMEELAASELRRYLEKIFPVAVSIVRAGGAAARAASGFLLGCGDTIQSALPPAVRQKFAALPGDGYVFSFGRERDRRTLIIAGKAAVATLYAVYDLLERYGARFYLSEDILPEAGREFEIPELQQTVRPKFRLRGSLPWFNFMMGATSWTLEEFKGYIDQLLKLRHNYLDFHFYNHDSFLSFRYQDVTYPTDFQAHSSMHPAVWPTSAIRVGREHYDAEYFGMPGGAHTQIAIPRLQSALAYARSRGFRYTVGIEIAAIPVLASFISKEDFVGEKPSSTTDAFQRSLYNLDPTSKSAEDITRARLRALVETYPEAEAYTVWYSELGPYRDLTLEKMSPTLRGYYENKITQFDLKELKSSATGYVIFLCWIELAYRILREIKPGAKMILSGWTIDSMLPGADRLLPDDIVFSSLSHYEPQWALRADLIRRFWQPVQRHTKRYTSWWEYDGRCMGLLQPKVRTYDRLFQQLGDGDFDAITFLHWRTRILDDNARYTALRCWTDDLTPAAYYEDCTRAKYGAEAAPAVREALLALEDYEEWQLAEKGTYLSGFTCDCGTLPYSLTLFTTTLGIFYTFGGRNQDTDIESTVKALRSLNVMPRQSIFEEVFTPGDAEYQQGVRRLMAIQGMLAPVRRLCRRRDHRRNFEYLVARLDYYILYLQYFHAVYQSFAALVSKGEPLMQRVRKARMLLEAADPIPVVRKYAEQVTNPGEKGVLVSLNRKVIDTRAALLKRLEEIQAFLAARG